MMQSLTVYIKQVRLIQWFICAIPLSGQLWKSRPAFVAPPLGPETSAYVTLALVLAGVFAILPWTMPAAGRRIAALCTAFLLTGFIVSYVYLSQTYVVSIATPNGKVAVSIGFQRSSFAQQYFPPDTSDAEMLMERGPYETEVQKLWTKRSVTDARLGLFTSYVGCLILLNFLVGVIARTNGSGHSGTHGNLAVTTADGDNIRC